MKTVVALAVLARLASAKTDIEGCTSFTSTVTVRPEPGFGNTYETVIWYVPDTLEICKGVDCGGGRAPPRNVPGCPMYSGTETVTPSFLDADPAKPTTAAAPATTGPTETITVTGAPQATESESEQSTSVSESPLDPSRQPSLGGGDETSKAPVPASSKTETTTTLVTQAPLTTPAPGNSTTTSSNTNGESTTISNTDAPGAGAQPTTVALAMNLMVGVAAFMAMM